jgi:hypothetical protein
MPTISISENITKLTELSIKAREHANASMAELYKLEGMLSVFNNLNDLGVTEIPIKPKPGVLETIADKGEEEVIDGEAAAVQA